MSTTATTEVGTPSLVQVPPPGGGVNVAGTLVTRDDGITIVLRQETIIADPIVNDAKLSLVGAGASPDEAMTYGLPVRPISEDARETNELLHLILHELRALNRRLRHDD